VPRQRAPSAALCTLAIIALPAVGIGDVAPPAAALDYPPALRATTVDDYHGTLVPDPYRGMEDLDSVATRDWVAAESGLTQRYLDALPHRAQLRSRLAQLYDFERFGLPFQAQGRTFYARNAGLQNQSVLYVAGAARNAGAAVNAGSARGAASAVARRTRVALDPNLLSKDGSLAVTGYVASHDGRLLAYGVSVSGSDWTDWHLRELSSGRDLPDVIRYTKYYAPVFSNDDRGLYYSAFPAPAPGSELSARDIGDAVYYHALGTTPAADRKLIEIAGHPDWQYEPHLSDDGRWLVVSVGEGEVGDKGLENVYLVDLAADAKVGAGAPVTPVFEGFGAAYVYAGSDAGRLYFLTTLGAPNGKVIAIDALQPHADPAPTVVAEGADAIDLTEPSVTLVDHQLIVRSMHDAHSRVVTYSLDGTRRREIVLPGTGTASGFAGRAADRATFYVYSDLITPRRVYRYDLEAGASQVFRSPRAAFDLQAFETRQVFYPGKDGTRIPMLLAYRKGLRLDGRNPLLLYGYGGFGIPLLPAFNPALIAWLELGGVYAIANIRGGGEYGEAWHRQANRSHKQVVFDDFIAAAEWLIAQRYTATPRLAIRGDSNGGLLVGACITQRPDLYAAAIAGVGVMDMLRFDRFGQGEGWTGEYGSPQDPADFLALYAYSPLHQVRPGTRYPATLIITGDHDTRVMPMHSFKFAAAMQAAQSGSEPVLLYIEKSSGHGGGPTVSQAIEQNADIYAFLVDRLKMQPGLMSSDHDAQ
jgi:prolyl oligopeptidase